MPRVAKILVPLVTLLVAAPAGAKPGHDEPEIVAVASISGADLDGPILLSGDPVWQVLYLSTFRGVGLAGAEPPSAGSLGPAFDARYRFIMPNGDVQTLDQTLYPCADDHRVWSFTPSGQDWILMPIGRLAQTGWWHSVSLVRTFEDVGLECDSARAPGVAGPAGGGASFAGLWAGLAALLALVAIVALSRRTPGVRRPVRV
jgi:hypothetical protein